MKRLTILLTLLCLSTATACHQKHEEHETKAKYLVTSPLRKDTELTKDYVAQVRAIQHIELRALERGYLQASFVDEGQLVERGQRLFQLLPMLYQAELQKAEAEAEFTRIEYDNTKVLADGNVVSPNELALARAKVDKTNAEVSLAKVHRGFTEVKAPFGGMVGRFQVRKGSLVDEGDLLTTLSDVSSVWVYFNVTEAEYLEYKLTHDGSPMPVKLLMANGQIFDQPGTVETIESDFNNETGNIAFRATFRNPTGLLRHGETGKVLMTSSLHDALVIPQKATFEVLDKKFVFVIDANNVVHQREITVAHEIPQVYIVEKGLAEGDKILLEGLRKVRDGAVIDVNYQAPETVLASLELPAE